MKKINPNKLRKIILKLVYEKQSGHIGGSFSLADIVSELFSRYEFCKKDNNKFILSKGHAVPVLYAVLHTLDVISEKELCTFREVNSRLQGHPDKNLLPEVCATTGSLGQGLSIAIGHALAMKIKKSKKKVFCVIGDGEMQEGQIWESLMYAPKENLGNLCCIVDFNKSQNDGLVSDILSLDPIADKVKSFGWEVMRIDGHDLSDIKEALKIFEKNDRKKPLFVIADTIKGKGVSFMQSSEWHAKAPNKSEFEKAMKEL